MVPDSKRRLKTALEDLTEYIDVNTTEDIYGESEHYKEGKELLAANPISSITIEEKSA